MDFSDIIWTIGFFISGCFFAVGTGVVTTRFFAARVMFWISPIPLIVADCIWAASTESGCPERIAISAILGGLIGAGLVFCLHWTSREEQESRSKANNAGPNPDAYTS